METMNVHWKRPMSETVVQDPSNGSYHITSSFQRHCEDHTNWSVGGALVRQFPGLHDMLWVDDGGDAPNGTDGGTDGVDATDSMDGVDEHEGVDGAS